MKATKLSRRLNSRFDDSDEDPRASLVNLVDVMLVFACGLLAALAAGGQTSLNNPQEVTKGREITSPQLGTTTADGKKIGDGYQAIGQVYRDPKTGKLLLIESDNTQTQASP